MKVVNNICRILALVLSVAALVLFFCPFATIVSDGKDIAFNGAQLGWGGGEFGLAKSADLLLCMIVTALSAVAAGVTFTKKAKISRYTAPAFMLFGAIYMLVVTLSNATFFVDTRPLKAVSAVSYEWAVPAVCIALFLGCAAAVAHLLLADAIEVSETKGKVVLLKRIVLFFRDYKSEAKKIVWPTLKDVVKNTIVVLVICLIIGAFIWLWDFGLGQLLTLILNIGA